jgi:protein disulfide-isomerase A1
MRTKLSVVLLGLLLVSAIYAEAEVDEKDVVVLDNDNFDDTVSKHPLLLVEFYAPWCGHCKKLVPEFAQAATELKESNVVLAKINVDDETNRPVGNRFGIQGFPTLKVFRDGIPTEYEGGRNAAEIVTYMKRQASPAVSFLNSTEQLLALFEDKAISVVGFFKDEASEAYKNFQSVANNLRNSYLFNAVLGKPELSTEHKEGDVVVWNHVDNKKYVLSTEELQSLAKSVSKYATPLIDEVGPQNYKNYMESGLPLVYLFVKLAEKEGTVNAVKEIAAATRGKLNWVFIDNDKFARHGQNLGLSGKSIPAVVLEDMGSGLKYVFDETKEVTTEFVKEWTDKFLKGDLSPSVKSEEIPTDNNGPVTVLVQKNFDSIVLDAEKAVLVEFYAPWCGHCKTLAPIYEEVGSAFADEHSVVIAKIDATANDVDRKYEVRGFPTLKFFPKGADKTPINYEGDRSKENLIRFVNQHAGTNVVAGDAENEAEEEKDEL